MKLKDKLYHDWALVNDLRTMPLPEIYQAGFESARKLFQHLCNNTTDGECVRDGYAFYDHVSELGEDEV